MKVLPILILLTFSLTGCQNQKVDQKAEAERLMDLSREWAKAALAGYPEEILSYWALDAVVMTPGQPTLMGHESIKQMLVESSKIPGFEASWEPKEAYVSKSGDLGYIIANNYFNMNDSLGNTITTFNKGVQIWKKQNDGSWKNVVSKILLKIISAG